MMKIELPQDLPEECIEWLWTNVGKGNLSLDNIRRVNMLDTDSWFYDRVRKPSNFDGPSKWARIITIPDEKMAMLFVLRWS